MTFPVDKGVRKIPLCVLAGAETLPVKALGMAEISLRLCERIGTP